MHLGEVDDVETPQDRPVHQDRADPIDRAEPTHEGDHALRRVGTIDPDLPDANRLDVLGKRERHGGDRRVPVPALERPVVDPDDPRVGFCERAPQR